MSAPITRPTSPGFAAPLAAIASSTQRRVVASSARRGQEALDHRELGALLGDALRPPGLLEGLDALVTLLLEPAERRDAGLVAERRRVVLLLLEQEHRADAAERGDARRVLRLLGRGERGRDVVVERHRAGSYRSEAAQIVSGARSTRGFAAYPPGADGGASHDRAAAGGRRGRAPGRGAARRLARRSTSSERVEGFRLLPPAEAEELFLSLSAREQCELLLALAARSSASSGCASSRRTTRPTCVQEAPDEERDGLLRLLDEPTRREVNALLAYAEDEAGGLMSPRYVRLRAGDDRRRGDQLPAPRGPRAGRDHLLHLRGRRRAAPRWASSPSASSSRPLRQHACAT